MDLIVSKILMIILFLMEYRPLDIDDDTQLVCKYLKAFCRRNDRRTGIDRQFHGHARKYRYMLLSTSACIMFMIV